MSENLESFDVDAIGSRSEVVDLIQALAEDISNNPENWTNITLASYLDALGRWLEAAPSWSRNMVKFKRMDAEPDVDSASWALFARALRTARTYE